VNQLAQRLSGRHTRRLTAAGAAIFAIVVLAVATAGCGSSADHQATHHTTPITHSPSPSHPTFTAFAGAWSGHGDGLDILPNGRFTLSARTYRTCGQDPPPCDTFSGNKIINGDNASGQFTSVSGEIASGSVTHSTDPADTPTGPITVTLNPSTDTINAHIGSPNSPATIFCGPSAAAGQCGA
jgi:hypothetical protein